MKMRKLIAVVTCAVVLGSISVPVLASAQAGIDFKIDPATKTVDVGQVFTVGIKVDASSQLVDGAQAYLNFDRSYLRVVDADGNETDEIISGELYPSTWSDVLTNSANNGSGQIDYAAGKGTGGSAVATEFTLATIRFKATAPIDGTELVFNTVAPRKTKTTSGLDAVTGDRRGGIVIITEVLLGDANNDSEINALDITKVERIIAGLDAQAPGADANQDSNINALDITKMERVIAGLD